MDNYEILVDFISTLISFQHKHIRSYSFQSLRKTEQREKIISCSRFSSAWKNPHHPIGSDLAPTGLVLNEHLPKLGCVDLLGVVFGSVVSGFRVGHPRDLTGLFRSFLQHHARSPAPQAALRCSCLCESPPALKNKFHSYLYLFHDN